jgi:prepilin-type N-terminal cleavage/methylation domain-containing protein
MTRPPDARRAAGFTLLEVVLAMTALGMVTAIVYGAFHLGIRSVEKGQVAAVSAQRLRAASDVIRRQIKSMTAVACRFEKGGDLVPYFVIETNPPSLSFVTTAGLHGGGGLEHVRYYVRSDPPQLIIEASTDFWFRKDGVCSGVKTSGTTEAVLLDGFRTIEFKAESYGDGEDWHEEGGVEGVGLPRSISIVVDGLPGSTRAVLAGGKVPVIANLESDDGYGIFEQLYGSGTETVPGETPADVKNGGSGTPAAAAGGEEPGTADEADEPDDDSDGGDE